MRLPPPPVIAHWSLAHLGALPCSVSLPFHDRSAFSPTGSIIAAAHRVPCPQGRVTFQARLVPESVCGSTVGNV